MKNFVYLVVAFAFCSALTACSSAPREDRNAYQRKIYLTEEDYMEDLDKAAQAERREAKPNTESNYIFDVQPDTQKNVYFFDDRTRPMIPGEPSERDYKKTKRLWEKPRRYSPDEYYGGDQPADSGSSSSSGYEDYED